MIHPTDIQFYEPLNIEIAPAPYFKFTNWDAAKLFAFALNIDGKIGWRLPTDREMEYLFNNHKSFFIQYLESWVTVTRAGRIEDPDREYVAFKTDNGIHIENRKKESSHYMILVRDI